MNENAKQDTNCFYSKKMSKQKIKFGDIVINKK